MRVVNSWSELMEVLDELEGTTEDDKSTTDDVVEDKPEAGEILYEA